MKEMIFLRYSNENIFDGDDFKSCLRGADKENFQRSNKQDGGL